MNKAVLLLAVLPKTPAMKAAVCVPFVPIRILADSPATPPLPISMLLLPVVRFAPALVPTAVLLLPVLLRSALVPSAVLLPPLILKCSA